MGILGRQVLLAATLSLGAPALPALEADALREGLAALYRGDQPRAAAIARSYVERNPASAAGRILLGQALMASGSYDAAYAELRTASRLEPENADALYFLGQASLILAQVEFEKLRRMAPDSPRVHQLMGEIHQARNAPAQAEREYLAALERNPGLVEVLNQLGDLKRRAMQCDAAVAYYERAARVEPENYDSVYGSGACALLTGDPRRAAELLRKAAAIDPGAAAARFALGRALIEDGQPRPAVAELKKAVELEPGMGEAYFLLGRAYRELGQELEALEAIRRARQLYRSEAEDR